MEISLFLWKGDFFAVFFPEYFDFLRRNFLLWNFSIELSSFSSARGIFLLLCFVLERGKILILFLYLRVQRVHRGVYWGGRLVSNFRTFISARGSFEFFLEGENFYWGFGVLQISLKFYLYLVLFAITFYSRGNFVFVFFRGDFLFHL